MLLRLGRGEHHNGFLGLGVGGVRVPVLAELGDQVHDAGLRLPLLAPVLVELQLPVFLERVL